MKKADLMAQPFIFIFIAFIAVLVLVFGVQQIINIKNLGEETQIKEQISKVKADIVEIYDLSYGTSQKYAYTFPKYVKKLCFINKENIPSILTQEEKNEVISFQESSSNNIFLFMEKKPTLTEKTTIRVESSKCFNTISGRLEITLRNNGQTVVVI